MSFCPLDIIYVYLEVIRSVSVPSLSTLVKMFLFLFCMRVFSVSLCLYVCDSMCVFFISGFYVCVCMGVYMFLCIFPSCFCIFVNVFIFIFVFFSLCMCFFFSL